MGGVGDGVEEGEDEEEVGESDLRAAGEGEEEGPDDLGLGLSKSGSTEAGEADNNMMEV